jgi:hypothetical protein
MPATSLVIGMIAKGNSQQLNLIQDTLALVLQSGQATTTVSCYVKYSNHNSSFTYCMHAPIWEIITNYSQL